MRIAWVATGGFDASGRERVTPVYLWLLERLARRHDVTVFVLRYHPMPCTYPLLGATIVDLGRTEGPPGTRLPRLYRKLVRAIRSAGAFDVVHGFWGAPAGVLAALAARRLRASSVVTFDSGEFASLPDIAYGLQRHWRGRLMVRVAARRASRVTVCTEFMHTLARGHGIDAEIVPHGVDVSLFAPDRPHGPGPPWRLLHVASLNRVKDEVTLLQAMARLVGRIPHTHLDIVGEDTLGGTLATLAARLGLERHVTFHGFQPTDRLRNFYGAAHLFIQSSRHEAAGVAVLEAAAARVPTVGTRLGYVADWAPSAAMAVPCRDPESLAEGIVTLLADTSMRERLASEAERRARAHDADWTAARFEAIYQDVASRRV